MKREQRSTTDLVQVAVLAERAGFDFAVISDHFYPWVEPQDRSGYACSILGAVASATERLPPMTYVTTPTIRYHPAIVARKAATMAVLSDGRFRLGLGALKQINEHVVGRRYSPVHVRHQLLAQPVEIIRARWEGDGVTFHGAHDDVEGPKLFDRPPNPPPLGIAENGKQPCGLGGRTADLVIATEPTPELVRMFTADGGTGEPAVDQTLIC